MSFSFFSWFSWTKWTRWVNLNVYLFNQVEWGKEMGSRFLFATPGVWELPLRPTASAVRNFVCGVCRWLGWRWLVLGLLRVDITLGDGCGIWEHSCTVSGKWNISRVILRLYGWVYKTWRLMPLADEQSVAVMTVGSQSRRSQIVSYG